MENIIELFEKVKEDFCGLVGHKLRGNTIEISTGFSTVTQAFISVFLSQQEDRFVVSDGGWLFEDEYELAVESDDNNNRQILDYLISYYNIKITYSLSGVRYYYKTTNKKASISSIAYDVANFVTTYVNATAINKATQSDKSKRRNFFGRVNHHLKERYTSNEFKINEYVNVDDNNTVRFSSVIRPLTVGQQVMMMYITGSVRDDFNDSIARATAHFQIINKFAKKKGFYKKVALLDVAASGFDESNSTLYRKNLVDALENDPIRIAENASFDALDRILPEPISEKAT